MRTRLVISAVAVVASLLCGCATSPPTPADHRLGVPGSADDRRYLGLQQETSTFRLEDIRCELLVIDCFDMYCHICQSGAKHVNELYRMAQERGLDARVKFVGLGLGDTPLEVATYKDKLKVPFPVFPDRKSTVAKQFGPVRLPNLIILRKRGDMLEVIHTSPGPLLKPSEVLLHIQTALNQDQSHYWDDATQAAQPTCKAGSATCRNPALPTTKDKRKVLTVD